MTQLARCWPTQNEVDLCIKREAETASKPVLLAVHQPMPLEARNVGTGLRSPASEQDFLKAFLTPDLPEGTLLQAVTGASGAGKSHLIRWLDAQLHRIDPNGQQMLIVRIPKSASLRSVVELILQPLENDPRFADVKKELGRAVEDVTPETGSTRLLGGIEIALSELAARLTAQLRADPNAPNARDIRTRIGHALKLPHYFNDPGLKEFFKTGVLARIVARSIGGSVDAEDAALPQFESHELRPPEGGISLDQSAATVKSYYESVLNTDGGKGFETAAKVLNEVLDRAVTEVFRLGQAMGGHTIQEIILQIRELLFQDRRELVLLIEDFAALSGIQEVLLSVCIQEAVRDGVHVRAPMRTAIAVTDGYLPKFDTILTRARREWVVQTSLSADEDVYSAATALVAGYLNAARWGQGELERQFRAYSSAAGLTGWVRTYRDEDLADDAAPILDAFGHGPRDVALFPYNDSAIRSLVKRHCTIGGKLTFIPRTIINHVLRDLLEYRDAYIAGTFPPPAFEGARPRGPVADLISRSAVSQEIKDRLSSFLVHWGDNPANAEEIATLPKALFAAFSLPPLDAFGASAIPGSGGTLPRTAPKTAPPEPTRRSDPAPEAGQSTTEDAATKAWTDRLEKWSGGERMLQADARFLRNTIATLLGRSMNWNIYRFDDSVPPHPIHIKIPNALGEDNPRGHIVPIAEDHSDPDGSLRQTLLAVARYGTAKQGWSYGNGDEDSAIVTTFIDRLARQYLRDTEERAIAEVPGILELLTTQAKVLGQTGRDLRQPYKMAEAALKLLPDLPSYQLAPESPEGKWYQLQQTARDRRQSLKDLLCARIGCFQGSRGGTLHAIDTVRLEDALASSERKQASELESEPLSSHVTDLKDLRLRNRALLVARGLATFATQVRAVLGDEFDKDGLVRDAKDLITDAEVLGSSAQILDKRAVNRLIEEFRNTALRDTLDRITRLMPATPDETLTDSLIALASQTDFTAIPKTLDFLARMDVTIRGVENELQRQEQTAEAADPQRKIAQISEAFRTVDAHLANLSAGDPA